jgi:Tetratricopeptide repeat
VFAAALTKDPQRRPASADEFVRALEAAFGERRPIHRQFPTRRVAGPGIGAPDALTEAARGGRGRLTPSRSVAAVAERPRQPAATWTPSSPSPGSRAPRRRLGALAALLAVFAIVGVAAAAAAGVFSGSSGDRTNDALAAGRSAQLARTALGHSNSATTQVAPDATPTAAELALTGHRQMLDGNYTQALQTLKQAVSTAPHSSPTYAYALYDLGRTELLSGDPEAAISVLRQRLAIPLQTAAVRATLNAALQAAAAPPAQATTSPATTSSSTTTTSTTPTSPSGGAGVAVPGQGGGPGAGGNAGGGGAGGEGSGGGGGAGGQGSGSGAGGGSGAGSGNGSGSGSGGSAGSGPGGGSPGTSGSGSPGGSGSGSGSGGSGSPGGSGSGGSGSGGSGSGGAGLTGQLAAAA